MKTMQPLMLGTLITLALTNFALADGGMFAPEIHQIFEHEQVAFLDWQPDLGTEALTIMPGLQGDMSEFAWVVPLPAEPTVTEADVSLIDQLFAATAPLRRDRGDGWSCARTEVASLQPGDADNGVDILQQDVVGVYAVTVLAADHASSLVDTLASWGYLHPENQDRATPILADYVERGWVFVTMKVDADAFAGHYDPHVWWSGGLSPLTFTFPVTAPVYPMLISAVSTASQARVSIFTHAPSRLTFTGSETRYANHLDADEVAAMAARYPVLGSYLRADHTLTRLERTMGAADMDSDLLLTPSEDQGEFRPIRYSGDGGFWLFLGLVLTVLGVGRRRVRQDGATVDHAPR